MGSRIAFLFVYIFTSILNAQQFIAKPVNNANQEILSKKFTNYQLVELDVKAIQAALSTRSNFHTLSIIMPQLNWDLRLTEFDLFKSDFYLSIGAEDKVYKTKDRSGIHTYKVIPNSKRAGLSCLTIANEFIYGFIEDGGVKTYIEPLRYLDSTGSANTFIVYNENDVKTIEGLKCGADELHNSKHIGEEEIGDKLNTQRAGCITVDVAIACDKTIFDNKGGIANSEAFVIGVLNNVQTNYDNEFAISIEFNVSTIYVATSTATDPWNGINNINTHLDVHRSWANGGGYGGANYAVATVWTRKYTSGAIGIAWVGAVCSGLRYNVCSDFGGASGLLRCLQAHELGHNFDALHDAGGSGFIMAPSVSNSNTWSPISTTDISNYAKSIGCVGICNGGEPPLAEFEGTPESLCPGQTVAFKDISFGFPNNWLWTFPGGTPSTSTQQHPVVQYKTAGIYDVTLKVTSTFGSNTLTRKQYIEVFPNVTNSFLAYVIDKELTTQNSSMNADGYLWKFGDGNTSIEDEPIHTYAKDGSYNVELCATNSCGVICKSVKVLVVSPVSADFSAIVKEGCAPLKIKYKNLSSANATTFNWTFPGGTPSISTEKEPTITYNSKGSFTVKLIASNSKYNSIKEQSGFVKVESIPLANFDNKAPIGNTVEFDNLTFDTILPLKYTYLWRFGDGKESNEKSPIHTYTNSGKFKTCLIVNNTCGVDSFCKDIELSSVLAADFSLKTNSGCLPLTVKFTNHSSNAKAYKWTFPGGVPQSSTEAEPTVTYTKKGSYDVSLIAFNGIDSLGSKQKDYIIVKDVPIVKFSNDVEKLQVKFLNESIDGSTYLWNFGDSKTSTEENPVHDYGVEGEFIVELIVTNECGITKINKLVAIYLIPKVNFSVSQTEICVGDFIQITDLSSNDVKEWNWQIEGASPSTSSEQNPKAIFNKIGTYTVKLTVKNSNGENSIVKTALIHVKSPIYCPKHTGKKQKLNEAINEDN
ncbi:MAG: PKD domain-containing protein [Saprospiraceae bacterium]